MTDGGGGDSRRRWTARLPLLFKLLLPFLILELAIGYLGVGLLQRDLSARARANIDEDLARRFFEARSALHDRDLYLVESVNLAANLQGMADAVTRHDASGAGQLLASVFALKPDLARIVVTDAKGVALADLTRAGATAAPVVASGRDWSAVGATVQSLGSDSSQRTAALVSVDGDRLLVVVSAVCVSQRPCGAVGVAIAALRLDNAMGAAALATDSARSSTRDYALYDTQGRLLAPAHQQGRRWPAPPRDTGTVRTRRIEGSGRGQVAAMYGPVAFEGGTRGILAVRRTTARAYSAARRARNGLAFILLGAMALTVLIGSGLARSILRQIRATLQTIGALGGGDLSARAPIINEDELGELARGVNTMAAQLETSYETLEQRVSERTDEVRQLLQQRSEFFAALSHELRTPLAVIVAQSDLLLEDGFADAPGAVQETGATVRASAQQLLDAVNQILEFAKTESGDVEVDLAPVSVADTFGDLEHTVDGLVRGSGLTLEFVVADDVPLVLADASRLRAVLLNLVGNAVKYTPAGGTVTVSASKRNGSVAIEVRDTGVGVPAEVGDRIFEPFYRVRSTRTQRGEASTGLGLALTKRLVEMQHGEISYTSTPKRGTTFTVTLPLAPNSNGKRSPSSARVTRG